MKRVWVAMVGAAAACVAAQALAFNKPPFPCLAANWIANQNYQDPTIQRAQNGGDAPWFDEYQAQLGNAVGNPPTAAWQSGVYRRDFDHGIALVNPKGNGTQTVTLEASFTHLTGQHAPAVNNGATVTSVTLQDRDGIILMRSAP